MGNCVHVGGRERPHDRTLAGGSWVFPVISRFATLVPGSGCSKFPVPVSQEVDLEYLRNIDLQTKTSSISPQVSDFYPVFPGANPERDKRTRPF
jgi:hypothetical protein